MVLRVRYLGQMHNPPIFICVSYSYKNSLDVVVDEQKANIYHAVMHEGRKRVLAIVAGILVARHIKTTDDLFETRSSPRTESLVAAAVWWAEKIMRKIDEVHGG